jgi:hypothetical protein
MPPARRAPAAPGPPAWSYEASSAFTSRPVRELVASIRTWITNWNDDPKPYVWHKSADEILDSLGQ